MASAIEHIGLALFSELPCFVFVYRSLFDSIFTPAYLLIGFKAVV
jgi:hypothetical protein